VRGSNPPQRQFLPLTPTLSPWECRAGGEGDKARARLVLRGSFIRHAVALLVALACGLGAAPSRAEEAPPLASDWVKVAGSRVRLIAGGGYAGVEIELEDGWKTYWRSPGEAGGVPPSFDWSKSENLESAEVRYPAPKRLVDKGGATVGYKGHVIFPVKLRLQGPTEPVTLRLAVSYGICKDICVPGEAELSLAVPGQTCLTDNGCWPGNEKSLYAAAKTIHAVRVPYRQEKFPGFRKYIPSIPQLWDAQVNSDQSHTTMNLKAVFLPNTAHQDAFVEGPLGVFLPLPQLKGAIGADGKATYEVDLAEVDLKDLKGKTITVTLVSDAGNSETKVTLPP
jgi:DsbC/DsbD-like thiol-disulfide interchange protein